ncbi:MAG: hypothetical protein N2258_02245, partial [Brevinematales bacterium]|nr:hypothetical protein [Brevinematales bacterium]
GHTTSYGVNGSVWILKLNADGTINWEKTYGGSGEDDAYFIKELPDGYLVVGYTRSFGVSGSDIWVLKLNFDGSVNWQKKFNCKEWDFAYFCKEAPDGFIIGGDTAEDSGGEGPGKKDILILKITKDLGNVIFAKTYGGEENDLFSSIELTSDGFIIGGYTQSFGQDGLYFDLWVLKTLENGDLFLFDKNAYIDEIATSCNVGTTSCTVNNTTVQGVNTTCSIYNFSEYNIIIKQQVP